MDIVEILRSRAWEHRQHRELREKAAQEIEHLRKELYAAWDEIAVLRIERRPTQAPLGSDETAF